MQPERHLVPIDYASRKRGAIITILILTAATLGLYLLVILPRLIHYDFQMSRNIYNATLNDTTLVNTTV